MRGRAGLFVGLVLLAAWGGAARAESLATELGGPCEIDNECEGGAARVCIPEVRRPESVWWAGGYCSRDCSTLACPSGSSCFQSGDKAYCLKRCRPQASDCREHYLCGSPTAGVNVCVPACSLDSDCQEGSVCRTCDQRCVPRQTSGVHIGEPCDTSAQCGTGESCLKVNDNPQGLCSQPCGTDGCYATCPATSTCQHVDATSASWCVRACTATSCASPLQCTPFADGSQGCLPPCRASSDCPAGLTCASSGRCVPPEAPDAGGCAQCGDPGDAGGPPTPGTGTGVGGSPGPGCGCLGAAVTAPGWFGALAVLLVASRRRRCPRP